MVTATDPGTGARAATFDLCGGHPVLDLVNSLDNRFDGRGGTEGLQSYEDLLRFTLQTHLLDSAQVAELGRTASPAAGLRALRAARALREAIAGIHYAALDGKPPAATDLDTLERYFHVADRHRELRWRNTGEQSGFAWSWRDEERDAALPVWVLARAALDLMLSPEAHHVRACESVTCRWLFLDTSKSHTRRWCKMKLCGNRMKARRFQAALRAKG